MLIAKNVAEGRIGCTYYGNVPLFWSYLYLCTPLAESYLESSKTYSFPQFKMNPQNVCYWLERLFRAFVFLSCLGIVIWQCSKCLTKFLSKPKGTRLTMVNSAGNMFPSVTVCPYPDPTEAKEYGSPVYNSTILSNCGISWKQYKLWSKWSNQTIENCGDPKSLYYNITWKLEDLISKVQVFSFDLSKTAFKDITALFSPIDKSAYGRCYTFQPPEQNLKDGIFRMRFIAKAEARVFINNNGVLGVKRAADSKFIDVYPNKKSRVNVEYSLYKMLDFQGVPCNNEKGYLLDKCVLNGLEKESLKMIGCVTPFGITKENICQDKQVAKKAFQLYREFRRHYWDLKNVTCLEPCSYMNIKIIKASETKGDKYLVDRGRGEVLLNFNGRVHETVAYYSYDELSFIAEIGGYVGLFLGTSIYQTADLFQFLTGVLQRFSNKD